MNYDITPQLLREIAGAPVSKTIVEHLSEYLPQVMDEYGINTKLRIAHFLAQIAHESAHFRTLEEYASGAAYEGRKDLGNIYRGDGRRYKGRGVIQLTGRHNYRKYGRLIGVDLENNPLRASEPEISLRTAAEFWKQNNLNALADTDNVRAITRRINGGQNGLQDRMNKLARAKRFLKYIADPNVREPLPKVTGTTRQTEEVEPPVVNGQQEPASSPTTVSPLPLFTQFDLTIENKEN
jgi:putative chitinase